MMEKCVEAPWAEIPIPPSGVYALLWLGKVVYIGQSVNVLVRLSTHRNRLRRWREGWVPKRNEGAVFQFDRAFVKFCAIEELNRLEYAMINKYRPKHNIALLQDERMAHRRLLNTEAVKERELRRDDKDQVGLDLDLAELGIDVWQAPKTPPSPNYLRR